MMDRKPWEGRDSHREGFGGRREWNSDRSDRSDRAERGDRRFGGDRRFDEDRPRFNRFGDDRREGRRFGDDRREDRGERRFGGDRPRFGGDRPRFGGDRPRFGGDRPRFDRNAYGTKTGPRARAFNEGRFHENEDYSKRQVVKIDAEVAAFFPTAKDVNDALRLVIALTRKVKAPVAAEQVSEAPAADDAEALETVDTELDEAAEEVAPEADEEAPEAVAEEEAPKAE